MSSQSSPEPAPAIPRLERHGGCYVTLEPLSSGHLPDLWEAAQGADTTWTYLKYGPFPTKADLKVHLDRISGDEQQPFFAIVPQSSGRAEGWASFCDIAAGDACIEMGSIWFSPGLQRSRAATEAIFLMMRHAFDLGYFRIAWRCNAKNTASIRAARRFGFTYEGTWRGESVVKGQRRDTAWFSILKPEWPARRTLFEAWLDGSNFTPDGAAISSLAPTT